MASPDITRLMDNARIYLPGALDAALQLEMFNVFNDFLTSSGLWYEDVTFNVTPTTDQPILNPSSFTYQIIPNEGGQFIRLDYVVDSTGAPVAASMPVLGEIILRYSPNFAQTYTARCAKTVNEPTTKDGYPVFPQWVLSKYNNELLDGLVGRMMAQPAKPYSSPSQAMVRLRSFNVGQAQAKADALRANNYGGQAWYFPQSFNRRKYSGFTTR